ncbi:hypothetical protein M5C99_05375 [Acidovorax sp. NCPPB 2350]|nr:hypothetical protein M5C99_05375 [Acidovorax sp. NCPPB 2350]
MDRLINSHMQKFFIFLGIVFGFLSWSIAMLILYADWPVLGKARFFEYFLFFAPMVGCFLPWLWGALNDQRGVYSIWLIAMAPVAGFINIILALMLGMILGREQMHGWLGLILGALWCIPLFSLIGRTSRHSQNQARP